MKRRRCSVCSGALRFFGCCAWLKVFDFRRIYFHAGFHGRKRNTGEYRQIIIDRVIGDQMIVYFCDSFSRILFFNSSSLPISSIFHPAANRILSRLSVTTEDSTAAGCVGAAV